MNSDPIELLMQLEEKYRDYGAVKLTASECWNCPFTFRYVDKGITTRIQSLQKLKQGKVTLFDECSKHFLLVSDFTKYLGV